MESSWTTTCFTFQALNCSLSTRVAWALKTTQAAAWCEKHGAFQKGSHHRKRMAKQKKTHVTTYMFELQFRLLRRWEKSKMTMLAQAFCPLWAVRNQNTKQKQRYGSMLETSWNYLKHLKLLFETFTQFNSFQKLALWSQKSLNKPRQQASNCGVPTHLHHNIDHLDKLLLLLSPSSTICKTRVQARNMIMSGGKTM